ncbi:MAG: 1-acyl-sn-glycerol-3-phosphate acyltransferase [Paramuribaculum sp.]|nr:1-acyl-sn-glycerol-3-phosphate acyltransferase [Paramuribaculum sp.]
MRIDLDAVLHQRIPAYRRWIPDFIVRGLENFIRQDALNQLLEENSQYKDAAFCRGVLKSLNTSYVIRNPENLPSPERKRAIFVCNHPLGALDGIIIIDMLSNIYGEGVKFVVNDLLSVLSPMRDTFLPVNKHGRQNRDASAAVEQAFESDTPVIVFPAGLVSRRGKGGKIADLRWNRMFITRAIRHHRDIIPLHFNGQNSNFFYNFANLRKRLGIKFNAEMICLPREVFGCRDRQFTISVGKPIEWQSIDPGADRNLLAEKIRSAVYFLQ